MNENEQSKTPVTIWNMMKRTNKMLDNCKQADTQTDICGRKHNASEKNSNANERRRARSSERERAQQQQQQQICKML